MSTASLSGHNCTLALATLPAAGIWIAAAHTEDAAAFALGASVTLTLGGLSLTGRIFRGEVYQGSGRYRIEGGAGGWRLGVQARPHQDDSGVRLSRVLSAVLADMPAASRETLTDAPTTGGNAAMPIASDRILGDHWMRKAGAASASLSLLTVPWYVRADGATYCGARPPGPVVDAQYDVMDFDPEARRATIATETPEAWVPGLTFTDAAHLATPLLLRSVTVRVDGGSMRVEVTG